MSKQEFILSFENQQKKRYEEFSFEYRSYSIIDKYQFTYQRDGVSLDIEYFKDLVSLSKKAARSSLLCSYLPIERQENIELRKDSICVKIQKPIRVYAINNLIKHMPLYNIFPTPFMAYPIFKHYLAQYDNLPLLERQYNNYTLNTYQYLRLANNSQDSQFVLSIYENISVVHCRIRPYLNVFDNLFLHRDNFGFTEQTLFLEQNNKWANYQNILLLQSQNKNLISFQNTFAQNPHNTIVNVFNQAIFGEGHYRALYVFGNIFGQSNFLHTQYYSNNFVKENFNYSLNVFENNGIYKTSTGQLTINKFNTFNVSTRQAYINSINSFKKNVLTHLNYFNTYNALIMDRKRLTVTQALSVNQYQKSLYINQYHSFVQNTNKVLNIQKLYQPINKDVHMLSHVYDTESFSKVLKGLYVNKEMFVTLSAKHLFHGSNAYSVIKNGAYTHLSEGKSVNVLHKELSSPTGLIFFKDIYKLLFINKHDLFIKAGKKHIYVPFKNDFVNKNWHSIKLYDGIKSIQKTKKEFGIILNTIFFRKNINKIYLSQSQNFIAKTHKGIYITSTHINIDKKAKRINNSMVLSNLQKSNRLLNKTFDALFSEKVFKDLFIQNTAGFLYKEYKDASIDTDYISDIFKEYFNINNQQSVISINKINKPMFTSEIIERVIKRTKQSEILNTDSLLDKLIKGMFTQENLLCDKLMHNANFISLLNTMVIKKRIQTSFLNNDTFVNKALVNILTNSSKHVSKRRNRILRNTSVSMYRNAKQIWVGHGVFLNKYLQAFQRHDTYVARDTSIVNTLSQEWLTTMRYAFIHQDISAFRTLQEIHTDNSGVWTFKYILANQFDQEFATLDKHMKLYEALRVIRTNNFPAAFYDQYFLSKDIVVNTLPSLDEIHRIAKELDVLTNDEINWAWVYQEDEGFDDPFKIDELLLPENDARYEDFEDILFNRKTLKPRSPVQIIDDYTFIAKYPNHYPIKDENGENAYKNIALEYLDVRTSIMRKVFIGYYKLWQDHIFEFSRMTIPQSAKAMLDYLYVWILMSFAEEDIPEALRVFRQIRWYLERGIIECSEYYITYEPDDLTSGRLDNTNLQIPSDLLPPDDSIPQNNTMYIDTNRHIITNNPNKLGQEAHITFYIDNNKETTISFSLHTLTPVYIILNEGLFNETILDTITLPTTGKMVYNIPYTGDTNTFTIKKLGADNHDNDFFIGNIVIAGMGFNGNLEINFNPKIQGNKVLNHVSQKVIAYMNLYEDNKKIMNELIKGNVHLSKAYEELLTYWDLHWKNKDKGKRLTIKRT